MPLFTTLSALSQTAASNPPDGSVDQPSTIDDQLRLLGSFIAQLRDGSGFTVNSLLPPGAVVDYAGASAPTGFLACDGSAVSRTTYAALFGAIGTTWGAGDGSTTFTLPDFRRKTTIGAGGTAVSGPANTVGATGGEETHALTTAELAAHSHVINISDVGHNHTVTNGLHSHGLDGGNTIRDLLPGVSGSANYASGAPGSAGSTADLTSTDAAASAVSLASATSGITASSNNAGSGTAHNNMQPSAVVNKIIKT